MRTFISTAVVLGLLAGSASGQVVQQLKRAREMNARNNAQQGVPPPAQPQKVAPPVAPKSVVATPQMKISRLQADIAAVKPGGTVTAQLKQQFVTDITICARGAKPSTSALTNFVGILTGALATKALSPAEQQGLAKDIEAVMNSAGMPATQLDDTIEHAQNLLQVSEVKRSVAVDVGKSLKALGTEIRAGGAK